MAREPGNPADVLTAQTVTVPEESCRISLFNSNLLLRVNAVSLNPIDHWLVNGRGANLRETYKQLFKPNEEHTDIIPGRDFHATVISEDGARFMKGQNVIGVRHPMGSGSLSEYISVPESTLYPENKSLIRVNKYFGPGSGPDRFHL